MPAQTFFVPEEPSTSLKYSKYLQDYFENKVKFNPQDKAHNDLLNECRLQVKHELSNLHVQDLKIIGTFIVGIAAISASIIFPALGMISLGAFAYLGWLNAKRQKIDDHYRKNLNNLIGCCEWALAKVEQGQQEKFFKCKSVNDMIDTLAPLTTKQQLKDIIDDSMENSYENQANEAQKKQEAIAEMCKKVLGRPLNQKERDLYYSIYGYKQGHWTDVIMGIYYLAANSVGWIKSKFNGVKTNNKDEYELVSDDDISEMIPL